MPGPDASRLDDQHLVGEHHGRPEHTCGQLGTAEFDRCCLPRLRQLHYLVGEDNLDAVAGLRLQTGKRQQPETHRPWHGDHRDREDSAGVVNHAVHTQLVVRPVEAHHSPTVQQRAVLFVPVDPPLQHRQFLGAGLGDVPFDPQVPEDRGGGPHRQPKDASGGVERYRGDM